MLGMALSASSAAPPVVWPASASLGIDFLTGRAMRLGRYVPMGEAMTFTRASTKLAQTRSGRWRAFASGEPAITDLGLSLEPESTNLVVYNTGNSGPGILLTGASITPAPDGDSPAQDGHGKRVTQGNGSADGVTRHSLNAIGGQTYSWSQSFKYDGSATWIRFTFSDNVAHGVNVWLNLQTMTIGTTGTFGSAVLQSHRLTPEVDGWHRLSMTGSVPNNASGGLSSYSCEGSGTSTRQAGSYRSWATQMEAGGPTGPILTYGSASSRAADSLQVLLPAGEQTLHLQDGVTSSTHLAPGGAFAPPYPAGYRISTAWAHVA